MELKLPVWTSSYLSDTQPSSDSCHAYCNVFTGRNCVTFECGSLENGNHSQRATLGGVPILRAFNIHHTRWIKKVCFGCCEGYIYFKTFHKITLRISLPLYASLPLCTIKQTFLNRSCLAFDTSEREARSELILRIRENPEHERPAVITLLKLISLEPKTRLTAAFFGGYPHPSYRV